MFGLEKYLSTSKVNPMLLELIKMPHIRKINPVDQAAQTTILYHTKTELPFIDSPA